MWLGTSACTPIAVGPDEWEAKFLLKNGEPSVRNWGMGIERLNLQPGHVVD